MPFDSRRITFHFPEINYFRRREDLFFGQDQFIERARVALLGEHNLYNLTAALTADDCINYQLRIYKMYCTFQKH
jgi:UDP-N-acetylmuramyl tripeptide synthase